MPLSEHEQAMLAQMEQALATEDPKFAHSMRGGPGASGRRARLVVGLVGLVAGLALVLLGVNTSMWVGVAGFAVMVAAVAYALSPARSPKPPTSTGSTPPAPRGPARPGFMDKLDERWEKRERGL